MKVVERIFEHKILARGPVRLGVPRAPMQVMTLLMLTRTKTLRPRPVPRT